MACKCQTSSHILHSFPSMHALCRGVGLRTVIQWSFRLDHYQNSFLMYQNCLYWQRQICQHMAIFMYSSLSSLFSGDHQKTFCRLGMIWLCLVKKFHMLSRDWLEPSKRWHGNLNMSQMHTCSLSGMEFRSDVVLTCVLGKWRGWSSFGSTCCNSSGKPGAFCSSPCCESRLFSFSLNASEHYMGRFWAKSVENQNRLDLELVPCWYLLVFLLRYIL